MRLFVAYRIAPDRAAIVTSRVSALRSRLPRGGWVGGEAFHLTFAFLGEQDPEVVPRLSAALESGTAALASVEARLAGGGFFPNRRRPRVGWIAVEPQDAVIAIAGVARAAVASCGVAFDSKPFKAHLTVVRCREAWSDGDAALFLRELDAAEPIPFRLDRVSLYESRLLPSGAVHTELAGFALR